MLSCVILLYAVVCIPVYAVSLMNVFNAAIAFNLVCMVLLAGLIIYDLFQDHNPMAIVIDRLRDPDPDHDGLGEE
jgi:hypothetical protein